ncbi:hypothetical protein JW916_09075 [Candidatus Sumerlaeota bacterium]|nr:hypothetical protein [Candidatus Sumerlaeota bacterium]
MFPPLPPWEGIHPILAHFPIGLLFVVPVLLLISIFRLRQTPCFSIAALILMILGVIGAFLAVFSGAAGASLVFNEVGPDVQQAIHKHEELAEIARTIFAVLTLVYAALVILPPWLKKPVPSRARLILEVVFLVVWTVGLLVLLNAAHAGGLLVHKYGIRALLVPF